MLKEELLQLFPGRIKQGILQAQLDFETVQEVRLRVNQPMIFREYGREFYITESGEKSFDSCQGSCITAKELKALVEAACGYSGYAFEEEIKRGYVTLGGGHRMGLVGRAVVTEQGIQTLKYISGLNIRVAHPVKGCGELWRSYLYKKKSPCHTLLISPPGCGKTTLLRDVVRMLSDGDHRHPGVSVSVVDERSEIAGMYRGILTQELGMRTDVLDGCPKAWGMEMVLRSMAPEVLAVDEIGIMDVPYIENALRCGCKVIATMHGEGLEDFLKKPGFSGLVKEKVFERYFILEKRKTPGTVSAVYDENFKVMWEEKRCI